VPGAAQIKAQALRLGFDLAGITNLGGPDTAHAFDAWLASGFAGEMHYLERTAELRRDARRPEPGMRSAVVVAMNYGGTQPPGAIARYARGDDYHEVMRAKLDELGRWFIAECDGEARTRSYVDTGPVLERDLARRAGLGWFGKNTNLINPGLGSFFFIGALFTDAKLETDAPFEADRCGTCTRCLDACPTQAFTAPRVLDSTRCISYLTIELKGEIPAELRPAIGEHLYGCDICQDVCPYNRKFARDLAESAFAARGLRALTDGREIACAVLAMSRAEYKAEFGDSAVTRAPLPRLKRNAAVLLGCAAASEDLPALVAALADAEPLVRRHVAWAVGRVGSDAARQALLDRLIVEPDASVVEELRAALAACAG
jgi:epoxyqueuosine reductase